MSRYLSALLLLSVFFISPVCASNQEQVEHIIKMEHAPFGVIFEIVESNKSDLIWAIEKVKQYSAQLRNRFPEMGIAVVSHGKEEFALLKSEQKKYEQVHNTVKSLVQDDNIPVHVCGTHASWFNKKPEDFPDYVDVTPAGPTEIANYEDMGYIKIVLEEPN